MPEPNEPTHGVHVTPGEVPEGLVPPSTSMATPKARIVVHESDACQGNITGWDCEDCEDDACEHECHDSEPTEPTGDLRERLDAALRTVGLARNLAAYRDAVLPVVEDETAALRKRAEKAEAVIERARRAAEDLRAHVGPSHIVTPYVLRILHALDQSKPKPGEEQATPIDWEAIVRQRERELKRVGEARHRAEAAVEQALKFLDDTHVNFMVGDIEDDLRAILKPKETR